MNSTAPHEKPAPVIRSSVKSSAEGYPTESTAWRILSRASRCTRTRALRPPTTSSARSPPRSPRNGP
eukprot:9487504-Pyramimonas_sp.AAC.1